MAKSKIAALFVLIILQTEGFWFGIGDVEPEDQKLVMGETLELNCTLTTYDGELNATHLYLGHAITGRFPAEQQEAISERTLHLTRPNVTLADDGFIHCMLNESSLGGRDNTSVGSTRLYVGNVPRALTAEDVICISDNGSTMNCSWCEAAEPGVTYSLDWKLKMGSDVSREGTCSLQRGCYCFFEEKDYHHGVLVPYVMNITGANKFGSVVSVHYVYANASIVKPRPPEEFVVDGWGNDTLLTTWEHPEDLEPVVLAVEYYLKSVSQWGDDNRTEEVGELFEFTLTNLRPGTRYDLSLSCKPRDGGYMSDSVSAMATTEEGVPEEAPPFPPGSFRDGKKTDVYWGAIAEISQNGKLLGHEVSWRERPKEVWEDPKFITTGTYSCELDLDKDKEYEVSVRAKTAIGLGPKSSLYIAAQDRRPPASVNVADAVISGSEIEFFFAPSKGINVKDYTVFAFNCGTSAMCESAPRTETIEGNATSFVLKDADIEASYSVALNTDTASSGLPAEWMCLYYKNGTAGKADFQFEAEQPERGLVVTWEPVKCQPLSPIQQGRVTHYNLFIQGDNGTDFAFNATVGANVTEYHFKDLDADTEYTVGLESVALSGPSERTVNTRKTIESKPEDPPQDVHVTNISSHEVAVAWEPTPTPNGRVTSYTVHALAVDGSYNGSEAVSALLSAGTVRELPGHVNYSVTVIASNGAGDSPPSPSVFAQTHVGAPAKLREDQISYTVSDEGPDVILRWDIPEPPNGPIVAYYILERFGDGEDGKKETRLPQSGNRTATIEVDCSVVTSLNISVAGETLADDNQTLLAPWSDPREIQGVCPPTGVAPWKIAAIILGVAIGIAFVVVVIWLLRRAHDISTKLIDVQPPDSSSDYEVSRDWRVEEDTIYEQLNKRNGAGEGPLDVLTEDSQDGVIQELNSSGGAPEFTTQSPEVGNGVLLNEKHTRAVVDVNGGETATAGPQLDSVQADFATSETGSGQQQSGPIVEYCQANVLSDTDTSASCYTSGSAFKDGDTSGSAFNDDSGLVPARNVPYSPQSRCQIDPSSGVNSGSDMDPYCHGYMPDDSSEGPKSEFPLDSAGNGEEGYGTGDYNEDELVLTTSLNDTGSGDAYSRGQEICQDCGKRGCKESCLKIPCNIALPEQYKRSNGFPPDLLAVHGEVQSVL